MDRYEEIRRTFIKVDGEYQCMLYEPLHPGEKSKLAVVVMHSGADYFDFYPTIALAERGYRVIASNANGHERSLDDQIRHFAAVVNYIREYPGVEKVVLLGHSGGATLISSYEAIAEMGADFFRGPQMNIPLGEVGELVPADAVMLLDPNFGNGIMTLMSLDPAVKDDPKERDPELDLFNPDNGYTVGDCHYSDEFLRKFWHAQAKRMNDLVDWAKDRVEKIDRGEGRFADDEPLVIPGGSQLGLNNKLVVSGVKRFLSHTAKEHPLIHKDGSVTVETVYSVRPSRPDMNSAAELHRGAFNGTVKEFLQSSSIRADEDEYRMDETTLYGVDWNASYCSTVGNARFISVPMLFMGMTGSYEYSAAEHSYYNAENCSDKSIAFVEGASHNFEAIKADGPDPDLYGDTVKSCFDYVASWLEEKFF